MKIKRIAFIATIAAAVATVVIGLNTTSRPISIGGLVYIVAPMWEWALLLLVTFSHEDGGGH